jgi:hypothetical protein
MPGSLARIDQFRLNQDVMAVIQRIGQQSPTCILFQRMVVWWPSRLETLTGYRSKAIIGGPAPITFPDGSRVHPFAPDAVPYQDIAVACGRLKQAVLTGFWIGTQAQGWTLEPLRVQMPGIIDVPPRPPGRVIPLRAAPGYISGPPCNHQSALIK